MARKNEGEQKTAANGGGKKDDGPITAVLKMELHCEGCAKKVKRAINHFDGVEIVKTDCAANKLIVVGNIDPVVLRERIEFKTKKKVELLSPPPITDGGDDRAGDKSAEGTSTADDDNKSEADDHDEKNIKEPVVSTVVMRIRLHCDGCAHKIKKMVLKNIVGVNSVTMDIQKDLITVTGTMNAKELTTFLKEKLERVVEIMDPSEKKDDHGGDEREKADSGGDAAGVVENKEFETETVNIREANKTNEEGTNVEVSKIEFQGITPQTFYVMPMPVMNYQTYGYNPQLDYNQELAAPPPPPPTFFSINDEIFSDENPNGCTVM